MNFQIDIVSNGGKNFYTINLCVVRQLFGCFIRDFQIWNAGGSLPLSIIRNNHYNSFLFESAGFTAAIFTLHFQLHKYMQAIYPDEKIGSGPCNLYIATLEHVYQCISTTICCILYS